MQPFVGACPFVQVRGFDDDIQCRGKRQRDHRKIRALQAHRRDREEQPDRNGDKQHNQQNNQKDHQHGEVGIPKDDGVFFNKVRRPVLHQQPESIRPASKRSSMTEG